MNSYPIVAIHGLFGWAQGELPVDYWGGVTNSSPVPVYEAAVGPISSWHDRACEVIAQVKGLRVDYGASHAKKFGHERYGRDYTGMGFYPAWDSNNPIHLIGHSAGGNTMRMVQHLLATNHYKELNSNADWIKSISAISSVLNGTQSAHILGANKDGMITSSLIGNLIKYGVMFFARFSNNFKAITYDFELDHWGLTQTDSLADDIAKIGTLGIFKDKDNLAYDLSMPGSFEANGFMKSYPNTYYFGYATEQTFRLGSYHFPKPKMSNLVKPISFLMGRYKFDKLKPADGWGQYEVVDEKWRSNDGLVPMVSQLYPFMNCIHKVNNEPGISDRTEFDPGVWYYENTTDSTGRSFDHFDIVCGAYLEPGAVKVQQKFYADLWKRLLSL